jgi:hypothetical protein
MKHLRGVPARSPRSSCNDDRGGSLYTEQPSDIGTLCQASAALLTLQLTPFIDVAGTRASCRAIPDATRACRTLWIERP